MDQNTSSTVARPQNLNFKYWAVIAQVFIVIFVAINMAEIVTFFKRELFRTTMRYILFANTLITDTTFLIVSNIVLLLSSYGVLIDMWVCTILAILLMHCAMATPLTLTAMTLERCVAICMPLRHGELCTVRNSLCCILIVQGISAVPGTIFLCIFNTFAPKYAFTKPVICRMEGIVIHRSQRVFRSTINQVYFLIMSVTIIFSYIKIVQVAKSVSGSHRSSSKKGLRTVSLHIVQLLLSFCQMWTPFIEAAILQISYSWFLKILMFDYIVFILFPRCLTPLIYGLRDERFFAELKPRGCCVSRHKRFNRQGVVG